VGRLARQLERQLDGLGLTLAQYRVLNLLADGSIASSRVADWLAVSPPSVTSVVDGLVARGFAGRRPDPADRRRQGLVLTPAGREALRAAEVAGDRLFEDLAATMGDDASSLLAALGSWGEALDRARAARDERRRDGS
jgi:DNA-binding MarR family transcriptional regulator